MQIEINEEILNRDIDQLRTQARTLRSNLEKLNSSMNTLNSSWTGEAKNTYMSVYQQDYNSMLELCRTVDEMVMLLEKARDKYRICDNKVRSAISQIRM